MLETKLDRKSKTLKWQYFLCIFEAFPLWQFFLSSKKVETIFHGYQMTNPNVSDTPIYAFCIFAIFTPPYWLTYFTFGMNSLLGLGSTISDGRAIGLEWMEIIPSQPPAGVRAELAANLCFTLYFINSILVRCNISCLTFYLKRVQTIYV